MDQPSPLEALRHRLALPLGDNAVFDGWTKAAVDSAAARLGIDPAQARLAMPKSAAGKIHCYIDGIDRALEAWAADNDVATLKIRAQIRTLLWQRLQLMMPAREAVRSALSTLAMPQNLALAASASWRSVDRMWRLAGDTSTDFNHYTKRMTLGAVYASTLLVWLDDQSLDQTETAAFLDRRIDNVMLFEKVKAQWRGSADRRPSLARFVGRLRYPPR
ncbi:MAG: COQ9 family protein [Sphingomonas sp.]|nr:COQ9 family protein [Sphingomonas sp.]